MSKDVPIPEQSRADRLFEALEHARKGGTLAVETIDDLMDFVRPTVATAEPDTEAEPIADSEHDGPQA